MEIVRATPEDAPVLERLLQLYLHDFSAFADPGTPFGDVGDDGLFPSDHIDGFWDAPGNEALLFRQHGAIAGFALLTTTGVATAGVDHAMAEFFVLRKYRRTGVGRCAVTRILPARPGRWEIAVADYNTTALAFWRSVLPGMTDIDWAVEESAGDGWAGPVWRATLSCAGNLREKL